MGAREIEGLQTSESLRKWCGPHFEERDAAPLRHTALSRMIAGGYDDYTVMEISGHSSTRMFRRYKHPTEERKICSSSSTDRSGCFSLFACSVSSASESDERLNSSRARRSGRSSRDRILAEAVLAA